jgi:hypothetical protein
MQMRLIKQMEHIQSNLRQYLTKILDGIIILKVVFSPEILITCLLVGLHRTALKPVNFQNLQEVIQDKQENPSQILECFRKALLQYTNLNPENPEGQQLLMIYFFFPRATLT